MGWMTVNILYWIKFFLFIFFNFFISLCVIITFFIELGWGKFWGKKKGQNCAAEAESPLVTFKSQRNSGFYLDSILIDSHPSDEGFLLGL